MELDGQARLSAPRSPLVQVALTALRATIPGSRTPARPCAPPGLPALKASPPGRSLLLSRAPLRDSSFRKSSDSPWSVPALCPSPALCLLLPLGYSLTRGQGPGARAPGMPQRHPPQQRLRDSWRPGQPHPACGQPAGSQGRATQHCAAWPAASPHPVAWGPGGPVWPGGGLHLPRGLPGRSCVVAC